MVYNLTYGYKGNDNGTILIKNLPFLRFLNAEGFFN